MKQSQPSPAPNFADFPLGSVQSRLLITQAKQDAIRAHEIMLQPFLWATKHTKTYNEHWKEEGRPTPYESFPGFLYMEMLFELFDRERIVWVEKSRDLMVSWDAVAYLMACVQRTPERGVLFQTQKETKAVQLIDYAKCLYTQQPDFIKETYPLTKPVENQPALALEFKHGGYIVGIPGGADQVRSYHPWGYLNDESSFQPEAGECYNEALSAVKGKIIFNSSAGDGWYADARHDIIRNDVGEQDEESEQASSPELLNVPLRRDSVKHTIDDALQISLSARPQQSIELMPGLRIRRTKQGVLIVRVHYSAHPERDPEVHPEWKQTERKTYTSQADWDREQEIVDNAGGGELVFSEVLTSHWDDIIITDPGYRPDPGWKLIGGFDHGKTNPTCLERAYVDYDGYIVFCGEYYVPGLEVWKHVPRILEMPDVHRFGHGENVCLGDPTMFDHKTQQERGKEAKAINDLYRDEGLTFLTRFWGNRNDQTFCERLLAHWANIPTRKPTVRIVCRNYSNRPQPGLHPWDCPNLVWELMRAKKRKLSARQLMSQNPSEEIIDRDNHARDCSKHILMSLPEPAVKGIAQRNAEKLDEYKNQGMDEHSLNIYAHQMARQAMQEPEDAPVRTSARRYGTLPRRR